ncbi:hypothetical protein ASPWEDRAFT_164292 [Aspergillus wentii DTO 134E9]|uniref:glucan 1,3-beta-glucosidase n=1 Tax=Aspergillus wentii DTO 134E9 TaxID=1073089 RepID=A0A1L9R5T5_ASPWE|nr:uncharacterized protein ASPWEDRAFT_164292 [Aspergillus wentii DTO 134E9]KAI9925227.1 hypothetical protein MW887_006147 [Aspergillus wentii]OJJ30281.1 hypothetical protein ASPWEDRAFT_164292 [Aspergillus wentii DTO 134E9]
MPSQSRSRDRRRGDLSRQNWYDQDNGAGDGDGYDHTLDDRRYQRENVRRVGGPVQGYGMQHDYDNDDIGLERSSTWKHLSHDSTNSESHLLSAEALARRLDMEQEEEERLDRSRAQNEIRMDKKRGRKRGFVAGGEQDLDEPAQGLLRDETTARVVSGAHLEEGRSANMKVRHRGGGGPAMESAWKEGSWVGSTLGGSSVGSRVSKPFYKRKEWWIGMVVLIICLAAIAVPIAVVFTKKHKDNPGSTSSDDKKPANSNLDGLSRDIIPDYAKDTILDPWTWYDTTDFNVTFTNETVGGLSIMGLNSTWDDTAQANERVPPLNESFPYGQQPIRGVNIGGWLSLEPFIVPSLFDPYTGKDSVNDEWTLCKRLGNSANSTLEKHYATFITEQDFADIKDAGLDHVRIQYSYWAVKTYEGDPYVPKIAWRYLLRAIEYARKYGLRVKLDLHGLPGSQNGWNHSGHQGSINWIMGTDGALNRKRSLELHDQLSKFFAQDRYKNVVTIYGLVNEPLMLTLPVEEVLNWTTDATKIVQKNNITALIVLHDGFLNLSKWKKMYKTDRPERMILDTHQYTTFNTGQLVLNHTSRINLVCNDWYHMIQQINTTDEGWGPTMCGEWSQADTDCAKYLNNVNGGTRWEGTYGSDKTKYCPTADTGPACSCSSANAEPADYSDGYKKFLQTYAEAQMAAFETAEGWFYWTWRTESAAQWSYRTAWKNGYMPQKAYAPAFKCGDDMPDFGDLPENY